MTEYETWIGEQTEDFIREIHNNNIPECFEDANFKGINLTKLSELDNKYIPEETNDS